MACVDPEPEPAPERLDLVVHAIHEDEPFSPALRRAVDDEVEALGRWLGLGVDAGH